MLLSCASHEIGSFQDASQLLRSQWQNIVIARRNDVTTWRSHMECWKG